MGVTGWPDVLLEAVKVAGILATCLLVYLNRRAIKTPSGDQIGQVAERTHAMASAATAAAVAAVKAQGGDVQLPIEAEKTVGAVFRQGDGEHTPPPEG
jgi:hypothetical protein